MTDAVTRLAPVLGTRRDGDAVTTSASDLLITVFGELMRPHGGTAWTQSLVDALALFDVSDKAARQAISRLANKGWLASERIGRRTRWSLTTWSDELLRRGAERIYAHGLDDRAWDQQWLVLLASVPEANRSLRAKMATRLGWAGFGSLGQGVWICPRIDREAEAMVVINDLGIADATLFRSTMTEVGDPQSLSARAWDLEAIAADYARFLDRFDDIASESATNATRHLIEVVDAWRRFPLLDPDLPRELHSADWQGTVAAQRFAALRSTLRPAASRWWADTEASFDSK